MRRIYLCLTLLLTVTVALGQTLSLPERPSNAVGGAAFAQQIARLPLAEREERIWREVVAGNVPPFLRRLVAVPVSAQIGGRQVSGRIFVAPDYLAVGSDDDYFFTPLTPFTAQRIADRLGCVLPTPAIVDAVYRSAVVKLTPLPIPPSEAMTTVAVFADHNVAVRTERSAAAALPLGALVAGDKKDIVVCKALADTPGHVAIYGWHQAEGKPIQPLYLGHFAYWADYSHGVRLVSRTMEVEGKPVPLDRVLADPKLSALVSAEGPLAVARYRFAVFPHPDDPTIQLPDGERLDAFTPYPGVRVVIHEPVELKRKVRLVLFALPNGSTVEHAFGRQKRPDDDWRYDTQHLGAQTRFLWDRGAGFEADESLAVAYIEADNHAWPGWLRTHDNAAPVPIVDAIVRRLTGHELRIALDSHSGGGAFVFAYLDHVDRIANSIDRIAFLDSEYNYENPRHFDKLVAWLRAGGHSLCAIAYDDAMTRYDGKPVVSPQGGTWGRTNSLLADLEPEFRIGRVNATDPERYEGLGGRIVFLLKRNPKGQIFHTVQVERNGFIESLLSGTPQEEVGYRYFGPRAYSRFLR